MRPSILLSLFAFLIVSCSIDDIGFSSPYNHPTTSWKVIDDATGRAISGVTIFIKYESTTEPGETIETTRVTDEDGKAKIVHTGPITFLRFTKVGYEKKVYPDGNAPKTVRLTPVSS